MSTSIEELAEKMTTEIIETYEPKLIKHKINIMCDSFSGPEKQKLFNMAVSPKDDVFSALVKMRRRNMVKREVTEILNDAGDRIVDVRGIVNFRLAAYKDELSALVDGTLDDYLIDREYEEFIKLLMYVLSITPPKYKVVNIHCVNDICTLTDESGNTIPEADSKDLSVRYGEKSDIGGLLDVLLTVAPETIVFHNVLPNDKLTDIITRVFDGRVKVLEASP